MTNTLKAMAAAIGLTLASAPAFAATIPPAQALVAVPADKMAVARRNADAALAANQRANALISVLNEPRFVAATTAEEYLAAIEEMTPRVEAARTELAALRAQVEGLPEVAAPEGPGPLQSIAVMVEDVVVVIDRMDAQLKGVTDLGDALRAGDTAAAEAALGVLSQRYMNNLDGRGPMMRARLAVTPPESSTYAQLNAMACLFDSYAAVTRGQLEFAPVAEMSAKADADLKCAREHTAAGREALAREVDAQSSEPALRAMQVRLAEINGRFFEELARAEQRLGAAATVLKAGGSYDAIQAELEQYEAVERTVAQIADEQMRAATRRGG